MPTSRSLLPVLCCSLWLLACDGDPAAPDGGAPASPDGGAPAADGAVQPAEDGGGVADAGRRPPDAGANRPPQATDDAFDGTETRGVAVRAPAGLLANDTDPDEADALSVAAVDGDPGGVGVELARPSGATLRVDADGGLTLAPNGAYEALAAGATVAERFTYTVRDGAGATATAEATLTITGENDPPEAAADAYSVSEVEVLEVAATDGLLANDTDVDAGDTLAVVAVEGDASAVGAAVELASGAAVTVGADGTLRYEPRGAFRALPAGASAEDAFEVTVADAAGARATASVTVTVEGIDNPPPPGLAEALTLSVCTTPDGSELRVESTFSEAADVVVRFIESGSNALLHEAPATIPAGAAVTVPAPIAFPTAFRAELVYERSFVIGAVTSLHAPSCYAAGLSASADCSTAETSRFTLVNDNDAAVDFLYSTGGGSRTAATVEARSSLPITVAYGETLEIFLNSELRVIERLPEPAVCADFLALFSVAPICTDTNIDLSRFEVTNGSGEDTTVTYDFGSRELRVPAGATVSWDLPSSVGTHRFRIRDAFLARLDTPTDLCNLRFEVDVTPPPCVFSGVAYFNVENLRDEAFTVRLVSLENASVETEWVSLPARGDAVLQLDTTGLSSGFQVELQVQEDTEGLYRPRFDLPTNEC